MLNTLRKIVQEVNAAKDLKAALSIIVQRVGPMLSAASQQPMQGGGWPQDAAGPQPVAALGSQVVGPVAQFRPPGAHEAATLASASNRRAVGVISARQQPRIAK